MAKALWSLSLAAAMTLFVASAALAQFTIIAVGGDSPPRGTGSFAEGLAAPALSEDGQAAFASNLRKDGFISGGGIFRSNGAAGNLTTIMLNGDATPDLNGNLGPASQADINIVGNDDIVVHVSLKDTLGGGLDDEAIYRSNGSGLTQLARLNQAVPGNDGHLATITGTAVNESGQAAFAAALRDTTANGAIYRADADGLKEIVRTKRSAPGIPLTFGLLTMGAIDATGGVAFEGVASDDVQNSIQGIFRGDGTTTVAVARQGDTAADGNGTYMLLPGSGSILTVSDAGQVPFISFLDGSAQGAIDNMGVFLGDGSTTVTIARKAVLLPDLNGRYLQFSLTPLVNNEGQVLFSAAVSGATGGSSGGLFLGNGTTTTIVARINQAAPGGGRFASFGSYALNDHGQVVFFAQIDLQDGGTIDDTAGLFFYDPDQGLLAVARNGQQLGNLGAMASIYFQGSASAGTRTLDGLNNNGQVAFRCFAGDNVAIAVWTLPVLTCSAPVTDGATPKASDCLFILRVAVGSATCTPACVCNVNGDSHTTTTDALVCLKKAVGQNVALNCPC